MTTPFTPIDMETLRRIAEQFAIDRDWQQFHTPRNLLLALLSEAGEAADIVRWAGDKDPCIPPAQQQAWKHELADIFILLIRLADQTGVDLPQAFSEKLAIAGERYPIATSKGNARKYNELPENDK